MSDVLTSKQKLIDMLAERSRKHDAFRLAEGRGNGYSEEMNAFDIAHGEVLDWLNDTDHLDELLGFLRAGETPVARSFQDRVFDWARDCFGEKDTTSREIGTFRFLEEALELAQACGCSQDAAERVLAYVYGRPAGEVAQEVGGVMVSLAVLCQSFQIGMSRCGEAELARVLGKIEHIRARHAAKPDFAVPAPKTGDVG